MSIPAITLSVTPSQVATESVLPTISGTPIATTDPTIIASPSSAQTSTIPINPCPSGTQFDVLCNLKINQMGHTISTIVSIIMAIAILLSLFSLLWGGILWIIAGGDKTRVTAARSTILASIVGLIMVFLAYFILNIVLGFFGLSLTKLTLPTLPITGK
jgi:hypothetical protein